LSSSSNIVILPVENPICIHDAIVRSQRGIAFAFSLNMVYIYYGVYMYTIVIREVAMPSMLRKQIYIAPRQERLLKIKASELHISESELIRNGIDKALKTEAIAVHDPKVWDDEKKFIASLMKKRAVKGGRKWTREELYDR
jgi:hypothetical protein